MVDEEIDEESLLYPHQHPHKYHSHHHHQHQHENRHLDQNQEYGINDDGNSNIGVIDDRLDKYNSNTYLQHQQHKRTIRSYSHLDHSFQRNDTDKPTSSSYFHFGHPLQRIRKSLQQSTSRSSLLPLHRHKIEYKYTMLDFPATSGINGNVDRENESSTLFPDNIPSLSTPQPQQQQQQQNRRKKSLAGKVKASVARPARAVGRRVFRNKNIKEGDTQVYRIINDNNNSDAVFHNSQTNSARSIPSEEGNGIFAKSGGGVYGSLDDATAGGVGGMRGLMNAAVTNSNRSVRRLISNRSMSMTYGSGDDKKEGYTPKIAITSNATAAYNDVDWPVQKVERIARNAGMLCGAYVLGAFHPEWSSVVLRMLEYIFTAWITCMVILGLGWVRKLQLQQLRHEQEQEQEQIISPKQQPFPSTPFSPRQQPKYDVRNVITSTITANQDSNKAESTPLLQQQQQVRDGDDTYNNRIMTNAKTESATNNNGIEDSRLGSKTPSESSLSFGSTDLCSPRGVIDSLSVSLKQQKEEQQQELQQQQQELEHPDLSSFYIIDSYSGKRISCNASTPFHISNEWFEMDMLVLIRTRDTDDPDAAKGTTVNDKVSDYMRNKQRRFEFQYQVKLKKEPVGKQLYFSCQLDDPIKMGIITKAFVSAAMAFVRKTNPTFHYNITGSKQKTSDGKYETPHMSFTVEGGLDRLVVTKPCETPPELGTAINEDPESIKKRKSGILTNWNTEDTYTLALWSSYVDFLEWQGLNLPGIRPFSLSSVLGGQSINLTMYLIEEDRKDIDNHYRRDLIEIIKLELSNGKMSDIGTEAKKWIETEVLRLNQHQEENQQHSDVTPVTNSPTIGGRNRIYTEESEVSTSSRNHSAKGDEVECSDDLTLDRDSNHNITKFNKTTDEGIDENENDEVNDEDIATAAELGEGIYLRSGDSVIVREFLSIGEKSTACSVINGGGFAVLARRDIPVVIEKAKRSKKNKLIKSGDTIMFSMIQSKAGTDEIEKRYLTLHRGWWLKWVTTMPSKNGFFTIFTHETELGEKALPTDETQSSFLTLGGSFTLQHKRWSRYRVGIAADPSTDFGGRLLSLYNPKHSKGTSAEEERLQVPYQSEDEGENDKEIPSSGKSGWIKPLVLCTQAPINLAGISLNKSPPKSLRVNDNDQEIVEPLTPSGAKLIFSNEHCHADVPAWIEMMDRIRRVRQLAYVVRVIYRNSVEDESTSTNDEAFIRLKSGKEVAHIMNIGQSVEIPFAPKTMTAVSSSASIVDSNDAYSSNHDFPVEITPGLTNSGEGDEGIFAEKTTPDECFVGEVSFEDPGLDYEIDNSIIEDDYTEDSLSDCSLSETGTSKGLKLRRKVKKAAKKAVVGTGRITAKTAKGTTKFAAKGIKGTGKVTGKVVKTTAKRLTSVPVARKSNKLPKMMEPKKKNRESKSGLSKTMKKFGKIEAKSGGPPNFVAGELCATEQTRRTASRVLERMSNIPLQSSAWQICNDALTSEIGHMTDQDNWFLDGDATHLGVKPITKCMKRGKLVDGSIVARCLWESHWREEWCGMYESCLSFYTPLAKSTCHEIFYSDITLVRPLVGDFSPLPGFLILVIETAWMCHYMAFKDKISRDAFGEKMDTALQNYSKEENQNTLEQNELQITRLRFWQGFQTLSETSLSAGTAKWAKVSSNQKSKERAILNGRRMSFDRLSMSFGNSISKAYKFVEDVLTRALTFSLTSLEEDPESFVDFLDMTSELRFLPLGEVDLSSPHAFCLFVNIYHCLLQQALLLSVNGPLHKKSIGHLMRTSCYEIGGDVFSLAELHSCVICGKMSKPVNPKPPYIEAPRKSNAYRYYALDYTDVRIHFVLNTADIACPVSVPVLSHRYVEQQLNAACVDFFCNNQLVVDSKRRTVTLPKVCEIHRNDFGNGEFLSILKFCRDEMDNELGNSIRALMEGEKNLTIRFQHTPDQYHSSLKLRTTATDQSLEMDYYCIQNLDSTSL